MPDLDTSIHLDMLQDYKRVAREHDLPEEFIYGMHWGVPESTPPLNFIKNRYVIPYVNSDHVAVEIGPGGGRWTQYLLPFKHLYAVDFHIELLEVLRKNFSEKNITFVKNNGTDFPGIEDNSIDYVFSFGVFVHLDTDIIDSYLQNMKRIVKPGGCIVIQYSDKTKIMAQNEQSFSENTPEIMRGMVQRAGYTILEEDLTSIWHSSVIRFSR